MQEIILKSIRIPDELKRATTGSITKSEILPVQMNRIIGGFDESLLTVLGCEEKPYNEEKQTDAA